MKLQTKARILFSNLQKDQMKSTKDQLNSMNQVTVSVNEIDMIAADLLVVVQSK
jgi:hypothetical protein